MSIQAWYTSLRTSRDSLTLMARWSLPAWQLPRDGVSIKILSSQSPKLVGIGQEIQPHNLLQYSRKSELRKQGWRHWWSSHTWYGGWKSWALPDCHPARRNCWYQTKVQVRKFECCYHEVTLEKLLRHLLGRRMMCVVYKKQDGKVHHWAGNNFYFGMLS